MELAGFGSKGELLIYICIIPFSLIHIATQTQIPKLQYNKTQVPQGVWDIYHSKQACCDGLGYANPNVCNPDPTTGNPTKHPTISRPEDDDLEVVPIRFDITGLPDNVNMGELREEMEKVLKRILLRLADRIDGLKVSDVQLRNVNRERDLLADEDDSEENTVQPSTSLRHQRDLLRDVSLMYDVSVVRDPNGRRFGPLIITYMRNNYGEILEQIQ